MAAACTGERRVWGGHLPVPGSPCLPRSGGHSPRGVTSQEGELDPHRVPLCPPRALPPSWGQKGTLVPRRVQESPSPSSEGVLSPQTHHCHRVWEGFVLGLLNLKLFPKCILIIKLHFRLNKVKEECPTGHCELPTHCPQPMGSSSAAPSSAVQAGAPIPTGTPLLREYGSTVITPRPEGMFLENCVR